MGKPTPEEKAKILISTVKVKVVFLGISLADSVAKSEINKRTVLC